MKALDLSLPYAYPEAGGGQPARYALGDVHAAGGGRPAGCQISLFNHLGTHVDVPAHLVPGGRTVDQYGAETWAGPAAVIGLPRGPNEPVTAQDLRSAAPRLARGEMALIATGWDELHADPLYATHHPYLTVDAAEYLVSAGVTLVGMDVQSVDLGHSLRPPGFSYTSLRTLLEAEIPVLHSLANLKPLAGRRVTVSLAPINFAGLDGAPVRALALPD